MNTVRQRRTSSAIAMALLLGSAVLASAGCNRNATDTAAADTAANAGDTNSPPAPTSMANPAPSNTAMAGGAVNDMQFYQDAMMGDHKEIAASQLEIKSGSSADVKQVAQKIMADHTDLDKKLMAAGGSMPSDNMPVDTAMSDLQAKSGADMDRAFVKMMVADHQEDIPKFENAARNASTPKAQKLAADALPTLRDHLQSVQKLQQSMGGST